MLTAVVVSASRAGLLIGLAEVLGVLLLLYLQPRKVGRRVRFAALALAAATVVLTLIVGFETASARFSSEALAAGRIQFAASTVHMIAAHPWVGWGLGCWPAVYPAFATFDPGVIVNQAHSDWLQWTAEGGLPVGLAMLALALWGARPAIRSIWGIGVLSSPHSRAVRLPVFASGRWGVAYSDSFHGRGEPADEEIARELA